MGAYCWAHGCRNGFGSNPVPLDFLKINGMMDLNAIRILFILSLADSNFRTSVGAYCWTHGCRNGYGSNPAPLDLMKKNGMMDLNAISSFHPNTSRFNLQDISGSVLLGSWLDLMKINGMMDLNVIRVLFILILSDKMSVVRCCCTSW